MRTLRLSDLGTTGRRGGSTAGNKDYHRLIGDLRRQRKSLDESLRSLTNQTQMRSGLNRECQILQERKEELKAYLKDSADKVDRFRRVGTALRTQCAELEEQNLNLRMENRVLSCENNDYRNVLREYHSETERYEKVLNKIYCASAVRDDLALEKARTILAL